MKTVNNKEKLTDARETCQGYSEDTCRFVDCVAEQLSDPAFQEGLGLAVSQCLARINSGCDEDGNGDGKDSPAAVKFAVDWLAGALQSGQEDTEASGIRRETPLSQENIRRLCSVLRAIIEYGLLHDGSATVQLSTESGDEAYIEIEEDHVCLKRLHGDPICLWRKEKD